MLEGREHCETKHFTEVNFANFKWKFPWDVSKTKYNLNVRYHFKKYVMNNGIETEMHGGKEEKALKAKQ